MSAVSPLIADWIREDLKWKWVFQPAVHPFALAPGKTRIPSKDYVFSAPEGVLVTMGAVFDSPHGGISMDSEPNLDFKEVNTISNNILAGTTTPNNVTYVNVPPTTFPGVYAIVSNKEWPWVRSCKLYLVNETAVPITCYGYGYTMAYLMEDRPMSLLELSNLRTAYEYFPELRETVKKKFEAEIRRYLR